MAGVLDLVAPASVPDFPSDSTTPALQVLALTSYPVEAAATRFRLVQLIPDLAHAGISVTVRPFLDAATWRTFYDHRAITRTTLGLAKGAAKRVADLARARHADVLLVMREAMILGPPVIEMLGQAVGRCPLVLDLDDATWVGYDSPSFGRFARVLKWPGKALTLIDRADVVTCGSRFVARFVESRGRPSTLVPAVVDTDLFRPAEDQAARGLLPVLGWVGTHSTFPYLEAIVPALSAVARTHPFRLYVVGSGAGRLVVPGVEVEHRPWDLPREADDFASLDIGLYPLPDDKWAQGKSALKSVQYLACGVPFVASPIGAAAEIGVPDGTHFLAATSTEWTLALTSLLEDRAARVQMGRQGRNYALAHHTTAIGAGLLAGALRQATS